MGVIARVACNQVNKSLVSKRKQDNDIFLKRNLLQQILRTKIKEKAIQLKIKA